MSFLVGPYCGEVLCDMLLMDACHILLGRPWLFESHVMHDGHGTPMPLNLKRLSITLSPLPLPKLSKLNQGKEVRKACT